MASLRTWITGSTSTFQSSSTSSSSAGGIPQHRQQQRQRHGQRPIVNRRRPRRLVGGVLEASPRLSHTSASRLGQRNKHDVNIDIDEDETGTPRWKQCEGILRSYIRHHFLPRNESEVVNGEYGGEVDPGDAFAYLAILVETKLLDPTDLTTVELQPFVHPYCRSNRITVWQKRITRIQLGYPGCPSWEFHNEHVWDLLGRLDQLKGLQLEGCAEFRLFETTSKVSRLEFLHVECQTRTGIHICPPHRLSEAAAAPRDNLDIRKPPPPHPLETLSLASYEVVHEEDLATVLLDVVLPFFPNVRTLRVQSNQLDSFQRIAQRLQHKDDTLQAMGKNHALHTLDLGRWVPKPERIQHRRTKKQKKLFHSFQQQQQQQPHPTEMEAMQILFKTFSQLRVLRGCVDHLMELYCVARILVVETKQQQHPLQFPTCRPCMPLSVWPTVLETAWKRAFCFVARWESFRSLLRHNNSMPSPDGIYHLLKHVLSEKEKKLPETVPPEERLLNGRAGMPSAPNQSIRWTPKPAQSAAAVLTVAPAAPAGDSMCSSSYDSSSPKEDTETTNFYTLLASLDRGFSD